jgi:hypothetical protein
MKVNSARWRICSVESRRSLKLYSLTLICFSSILLRPQKSLALPFRGSVTGWDWVAAVCGYFVWCNGEHGELVSREPGNTHQAKLGYGKYCTCCQSHRALCETYWIWKTTVMRPCLVISRRGKSGFSKGFVASRLSLRCPMESLAPRPGGRGPTNASRGKRKTQSRETKPLQKPTFRGCEYCFSDWAKTNIFSHCFFGRGSARKENFLVLGQKKRETNPVPLSKSRCEKKEKTCRRGPVGFTKCPVCHIVPGQLL